MAVTPSPVNKCLALLIKSIALTAVKKIISLANDAKENAGERTRN
jgi:hypothetical protein